MRLYYQGTLDFACGIYAVINALSCVHGLDLASARGIFQEAFVTIPENPALWKAFTRNETDHYWFVKRTLTRWCRPPYRACTIIQPFGTCLLPGPEADEPGEAYTYLPEQEDPRGPIEMEAARREAEAVWGALYEWFASARRPRAALLRFHRFLPGVAQPIISHWTTVSDMQGDTLILHDASPEKHAIRSIKKEDCMALELSGPIIRLVPESLVLIEHAEFNAILQT